MSRRTGRAIANSGVAGAILGHARHEAIQRSIRTDVSRLEHRGHSVATEFVPANARLAADSGTNLNGVADEVRLVGSEITVRHAEHEAVADGVNQVGSGSTSRLGNTCGICRIGRDVATRSVSRDRHGRLGEGRVGRIRPVHMKLPQIERVRGGCDTIENRILNAGEVFRSARGWRRRAFHVGGLKAVPQKNAASDVRRIAETLRSVRRPANQHIGAIEGARQNSDFRILVIRVLNVRTEIVSIRPGCEFRPIGEVSHSLSIGT